MALSKNGVLIGLMMFRAVVLVEREGGWLRYDHPVLLGKPPFEGQSKTAS